MPMITSTCSVNTIRVGLSLPTLPTKKLPCNYLTEFSDPANYQAFVDAVGFIPTQPTAKLNTGIGTEVAPYLANFRVGYEQYWIAPKGAGQFANPWASYFKPFGTV